MLAQGSKLSYSYISPNYTVYTKTNNGNNDDQNLVNLYKKKVHSWSFAILWQFDCHLRMSQFLYHFRCNFYQTDHFDTPNKIKQQQSKA